MLAMEILLLVLILVGLGVLAWRDFITPRRQRRMRREHRREGHRRGKIRALVWSDLWSLRKVRRLSDQRDTSHTQPTRSETDPQI